MNKNKKDQFSKTFAFVLLVGAFIASLVIGINGVRIRVHNYIESKKPVPPTKHDFYEDGQLWFYEPGTYNLVGTYKCNGKDIYCGYAYELIDDSSYSLQYYDSNSTVKYLSPLAIDYYFIVDAENEPDQGDQFYRNEKIKLVNSKNGNVIKEYGAVKSYAAYTGITGGIFIVRDVEGKWGVVQITATGPEEKIPCRYDYIGLFTYDKKQFPMVTNKYVVKSGNTWSVIDSTGREIITNIKDPIFGYEGTTVVTLNDNKKYDIYDGVGNKLNNWTSFKSVQFTRSGYILAEEENNRYAIYDNTGKELKSDQMFFKDDVTYTTDGDQVIFKKNAEEVYRGPALSNNGQELQQ